MGQEIAAPCLAPCTTAASPGKLFLFALASCQKRRRRYRAAGSRRTAEFRHTLAAAEPNRWRFRNKIDVIWAAAILNVIPFDRN